MSDLEASQTYQNLKDALKHEAIISFLYRYYSILAQFEGKETHALKFKEFAEGGEMSVGGCMDFLRLIKDPLSDLPIGEHSKNIESLLQMETQSYNTDYPQMARRAREEGFTDIASWFDTLASLKCSHAATLKSFRTNE